jgi:hypothetical protein
MLTGKLPIGRFELPSKKVHVDVRLDEIVLRSLESEPSRRYQQVSEIKEQVDMLSRTDPRAAHPGGNQSSTYPDAHAPNQAPANWMSSLLGVEPEVGQQLIHVTAAVLGAAGTILILAMAFGVMKADYALFAGVACYVLAGLVERIGPKLFSGDPYEAIAGNTKLQAALAMSAGPQKDQTLVRVAQEAAEEGENAVAEVALRAIQDPRARDEAAATCALQIAENEGADAALPVARMIQENARRDHVLQKLVDM